MEQTTTAATDTIPRASLESIVSSLEIIASASDAVPFDDVRIALQQVSLARPSPLLRTAMLSTTRDVLADLRRLKLIDLVGPLPRPSQTVQKECLCRLTLAGIDMARKFQNDKGLGYDALFALWYEFHPHFATLITRLQSRPFFLPEFTGAKHLSPELIKTLDTGIFAEGIAAKTVAKLPAQFFEHVSSERVILEVTSRAAELHSKTSMETVVDPQQAVEKIQDTVVAPAILACEGLEFDRVSLKHILKAARDFFACSSTTMLPDCDSRTYFITSHLDQGENDKTHIVHHGVRYAEDSFGAVMRSCYEMLNMGGMSWVDAYALRAQVCVDLRIQQEVFNRCLGEYVERNPGGVGTELAFKCGPAGEKPIEVRGKEIGLIKLTF
jgi:hypothetical protein